MVEDFHPQNYGEEKTYKEMIERHGKESANKRIEQMEKSKEKLKRTNWKEYKRRYGGH